MRSSFKKKVSTKARQYKKHLEKEKKKEQEKRKLDEEMEEFSKNNKNSV